MPLTVPQLVFRADKLAGLANNVTCDEFDQNFRSLRDFANALSGLLEVSLNSDGTLKDGAISTAAKMADRVITAAKLHWWANFYGVAAGTDTYQLTLTPATPVPANYGDGSTMTMLVLVKFTNGNTGASTLEIMGLGIGAKAIKKNVSSALVAGDIVAGDIHMLAYDGTNWQLLSPHPSGGQSEGIFNVSLTGNQTIVTPAIEPVHFDDDAAPHFDVDAAFNTGTYLFTVPETGYYQLDFSCYHDGSGLFELRKNALSTLAEIVPHYFGAGPIFAARYSGLSYLTLGDSIGIWANASYGSNIVVHADYTVFCGYKLC